MKAVYRRGLPVLLTAALTAGAVGAGTPALAAGDAPTGTYKLDSNAIWTGQTVTLTESALTDDDTEAATVSRVITWGDGATQSAEAGSTSWTHTYATARTNTVSVTLSDGTVQGPGTLASASVAVTTPPGTLGWQKNSVYTGTDGSGRPYLTEAVFAPTGMSTNATEAWTEWGDGEYTLLKEQASSTTVPHYFGPGTHTPQVQFGDSRGKANPRPATPLNVSIDSTSPTVALQWPASPNRAAAWPTVRGTAKDSQAGMDYVSLVLFKWNNASGDYVYNFGTKKWIKWTGQDFDQLPASVENIIPVTSTGTWTSKPVAGLAKGWHFEIWPIAIDKVGNFSNPEYYAPVWLAS